ncbi:MAG: NAD(P)/FAD-dependent oxidoreductase [Betaproteobacteria bacterium]|nr:NAD(P)/FAD-dependent oxidoreductase [Betaproteobacteria bacterium]MCC7217114.1 NAD(P)/FAD-dependent oxidoreductase [Burkholderiales bacterium]
MSKSSASRFDAVVVGGGHNGLVCAAYLAAAGLSVCVVERRAVLGGAAVTEEFHPGFRNSTASYTVSLLDPHVVRDLNLAAHGLVVRERTFANFLPLPDGGYLKVGGGIAATQAEVARFSRRDADALPGYYAMLDRVAAVLRRMLGVTPPNIRAGVVRDAAMLVDLARTGGRLRGLSLPERRDLVELFTKSAGDVLDRWFESAPIKAAFGFDAVVGNFASPYTPGSAYVLLHHVFGEVNGKPGQWGHAVGGMGAITQAMAAECAARGVLLRTRSPVARVLVKAGRAAGVELASGEVVEARRVVANVNPKLLCERLVAPEHLPEDFRARIAGYRCGSGTFRMNVALAALPDFTCLPGAHAQPHHASGIVVAPSLAYMEQAFFDARTHGWSRAPIVEVLIPSTVDATLAPPGAHVASLFCQHAHPDLPSVLPGRTWDDARDEVADLMIATVNRHAPNFAASVIGRRVLSPLDLEREFGLVGGDIFHGALSLDQLFSARPVLGHADYRMPVRGLYLCGAGAHPGGGVTGIPGRNAAREIVRDARRRRH